MQQADLVNLIRMVVQEQLSQIRHEAVEGVVFGSSWNPITGTIDVLVGHTATLGLDGDPANDQWIEKNVPLCTSHVGDQGGPIGGERCILIPVRGGWRAILDHGPDDSPNALQGEKNIHLRDINPVLVRSCYVKVQHDATRLGHAVKTAILSPLVNLGIEQGAPEMGVVRQADLQKAITDLQQSTQDAINALSREVQLGSGVPAPSLVPVVAISSATTFSK